MRVCKLSPGLHRHLSLSDVSDTESGVQLASKALLVPSADRDLSYRANAITETTAEMDATLQQVGETAVIPMPDAMNMCDTLTLCGEA